MAKRPMPKFTRAPDELVALFARVTEGLPEVEPRKMFSYPAAFVHGQMFASLFQDRMMLRLSEADRASFLRDHDARMFAPMGRPMQEYVEVPASLTSSLDALRDWVRRARDYAASLPPKERGRGKADAKAKGGAPGPKPRKASKPKAARKTPAAAGRTKR